MLKVLPKTLEVHYDNPTQWLSRLVGWRAWGNHPWCTDLCNVLYFNLHKLGDTSILKNDTHCVVQFNNFYIDIACNCYIYDFDWFTQTNPTNLKNISQKRFHKSLTAKYLPDFYANNAIHKIKYHTVVL